MEQVLITGGSGFLGGHLIKVMQNKYNVIATYFKNNPNYSRTFWRRLDLTLSEEIEQVFMEARPNIVIHNAAIADLDVCEGNPREAETVNLDATRIISDLCGTFNARLFYISTDQVFDGSGAPYKEDDRPNPINFYGWTKWQAELFISENNPRYVIVRAPIIYGPSALSGTSSSERVRKSLLAGRIVKLISNQIRTPIYAGNLAEAILELTEKKFTGIIHLAGSERISRYEFGVLLAEHLNLDRSLIKAIRQSDSELEAARPLNVSLNIRLAQSLLKTRFLNCREGIRNAYL